MVSRLSYHLRENDVSKHYGPMVVGQNSTVEPSVMSDAIYRNKPMLAHGCHPAILRGANQLAEIHHAIHINNDWIPKSTLHSNEEVSLFIHIKIYRGHE